MKEKKALPFATLALILINILIFIYLNATGTLASALQQYGLRPAAILQGQGLHTLLTSMFMHGSWEHLIGNMLFLVVFGIILERRIGTTRFLVIYVLADLAASGFDIATRSDPTSLQSWVPAYGASAAIAGIAGACFIGFPSARAPLGLLTFLVSTGVALVVILAVPMSLSMAYALYLLIGFGLPVFLFLLSPLATAPLWPFVLLWILLQAGFGILVNTLGVIGVGLWAHISGFLAGVFFCLLLKPRGDQAAREEIPAIG